MKLNRIFRECSSQLINLKVWPIQKAVVCLMLALGGEDVRAQEQPPSAEANYEFVSGTVAELPPGRLVVNRAVIGKPAEHRTFLVTGETKIEGKLKLGARVTVGFKPTEEGDLAVRIIVRPPQSKSPA
jgi:hypothetical protein